MRVSVGRWEWAEGGGAICVQKGLGGRDPRRDRLFYIGLVEEGCDPCWQGDMLCGTQWLVPLR